MGMVGVPLRVLFEGQRGESVCNKHSAQDEISGLAVAVIITGVAKWSADSSSLGQATLDQGRP